ncbi:hypothetical protein G6F42_016009 [Rhizopus arrhizus]|nr:hypothetical protein G6F42_016009 [Rhizopus arrhizus]
MLTPLTLTDAFMVADGDAGDVDDATDDVVEVFLAEAVLSLALVSLCLLGLDVVFFESSSMLVNDLVVSIEMPNHLEQREREDISSSEMSARGPSP